MGINKLRELTSQLQKVASANDAGSLDQLRVITPLLVEVVHEVANLETMISALERRLEKLEAGERAIS
jgi:hypothetical protein